MRTIFLILNYKTYKDTIKLTKDILTKNIGERIVVIVDNASPNESFSALSKEFSNVEGVDVVSSGENGGYAKGNNFGLRYIKKYNPEYVCIINNDVYFEMDTIEHLENQYKEIKDVAFLSPLQFLINQNHPLIFSDLCHIPTLKDDIISTLGLCKLPIHQYQNNCGYHNLQEVKIVPGAFLFVNYKLFESMDFFEERTFLFCEERFTAKKVEEAGLHSYLQLDEKYIHAHSVTINSEASVLRQRKMLFDGKILYTRLKRRNSFLSTQILFAAYYLGNLLIRLKSFVRFFIRKN